MSAYTDALRLLARRELSVTQLRGRLVEREHPSEEIDRAIEHLLETRALDDGRVARAHARTAAGVKGRGRLRVMRELNEMGIARETASEALADVFADVDERALITKAVQKKMRGRTRIADVAERARLYQYLMRQGFTPAGISAALQRFRGAVDRQNDE